MRKKIFIIHGEGVKDGVGRESGGDLDTIGANVFYSVWARNFLREELKREPVPGGDYDFDFLNYSAGLYHLTAHRGCDVYIPDFPVDAIAPRLKLTEIKDEAAVDIINKFTAALGDFRTWIVSNAPSLTGVYKKFFNGFFSQSARITEHQEVPALKIAHGILNLTRILTEISLSAKERKLNEALSGVLRCISGEEFYSAKKEILSLMGNNIKYDMSEIAEKKEDILAFDAAHARDMVTRGRVGYTDEFMIAAVETAAYIARGFEELRELPFDDWHRKRLSEALCVLANKLKNVFLKIREELSGLENAVSAKEALNIIGDLISIADAPLNYRPEKNCAGGFRITAMLTMEATGRAVPEIEIVFKRLRGGGRIFDLKGNEIGAGEAVVKTDASGAAGILYKPSTPDENFRFGMTYDGLRVLLVPDIGKDEDTEDIKITPDPTMAQAVVNQLLVKMFRVLKENDVNVVSIDDHHPYTEDTYNLLKKLQNEGVIGSVQVHAKPRGIPEKNGEKKCGADLIYEKCLQGKSWDNEGLRYLRNMAHVQDLHLGYIPLGIELSKLIGSSFGKIEMVKRLSEIKNRAELKDIMRTTGWDKKVKDYEAGLAKVLPRTETNMTYIDFMRKPADGMYDRHLLFIDKIRKNFLLPKEPEEREIFFRNLYCRNPANRLRIAAVLPPFTNPKKGETKINVASALNYLLRDRKYYADYFFYCYGSGILTTRKPNDRETTLDLSELMQNIGTPADGGHSGAATCQPASNPAFPQKRLLKVTERNFIEFLYYIGGKIEDYAGGKIELLSVKPVPGKKYGETYGRVLSKIKRNLIEYIFKKGETGEEIRVILAKSPRAARGAFERKPGTTQVIEYIGRECSPDYIFLLPGGLNSMILYNFNDPEKRLDLPGMARVIGWDEDGGHRMISIATPTRNRRIPRYFRKRDSDFLELARLFSDFINEGQNIWRVTGIKQITE
ncbi:MAG: hypothetical protein ABIJ15_01570 [bacterium]